jgi:hypothetical protein
MLEERARVIRRVQRLRYHLKIASFNGRDVYHKSLDSGESWFNPGTEEGDLVPL